MKDMFWSMIDQAKWRSEGDLDKMYEYLGAQMESLAVPELMFWTKIFEEYCALASSEDIREICRQVAGDFGQQGMKAFCCWLIAQGKQVYYAVLRHPEILTEESVQDHDMDFEELSSLPIHVFLRKKNIDKWDLHVFQQEYAQYELPDDVWESLRIDDTKELSPDMHLDFVHPKRGIRFA